MTIITFDINEKPKEYIFNEKYFPKYNENGVSIYNKKFDDIYIITKKSVDDLAKWYEVDKTRTGRKTTSSFKQALETQFYYIELKNNNITKITWSQHQPYDLLKTALIKYISDREHSILKIFKDIYEVKCSLIGVVRLDSSDNSVRKLNITKKDFLKNLMDNNIYDFYLKNIKYNYPENIRLMTCHIYSYINKNKIEKIIVYPTKINTSEQMKTIVDKVYNDTMMNVEKYKIIATELYYYTIELLIYCDKYNSKLKNPNENYVVKEDTFDTKFITMFITKYGLNKYTKINDFYELMKLLSSKYQPNIKKPIQQEEELVSKKNIKSIQHNEEELVPKKIIKKKHEINNTNKSVLVDVTKKKVKKNNVITDDESNSETDDSEDYKDSEESVISFDKTSIPSKNTNERKPITTYIDKSIDTFVGKHIIKKKDAFIKLQDIVEIYKNSKEYKKININGIDVTRKYMVTYFNKYKWFRDNFKARHKELSSVLMNYTIKK